MCEVVLAVENLAGKAIEDWHLVGQGGWRQTQTREHTRWLVLLYESRCAATDWLEKDG
jgi:hypothetical protein